MNSAELAIVNQAKQGLEATFARQAGYHEAVGAKPKLLEPRIFTYSWVICIF